MGRMQSERLSAINAVDRLVLWLFFGSGCGVSIASAALYALLPLSLAPGMRELLIGGCLTLAVVFVSIGWLVRNAQLDMAAAIAGWCASLLIVLISVGLGEGVHAVVLAFLSVVICAVTVLSGIRVGVVMSVAGLLAVGALALAESRGWITGAAAVPLAPIHLHVISQALLIVSSIAIGALMTRVISIHLREVRERETRFRTLLRLAARWYWELDEDYRVVLVEQVSVPQAESPNPPSRLVGRRPWEIARLGLDDTDMQRLRQTLDERRPFTGVQLRQPDPGSGQTVVLSLNGEPRFDPQGRFVGYWGVALDITAEVTARQTIAANEMRYRALFESCPTPLLLHRNGVFIDVNSASADLLGYPSREAMIGMELALLYEEGDSRDEVRRRITEGEKMPVGWQSPVRAIFLLGADGRRKEVQVRAVRVMTEDGPATLSLLIDETERKRIERALEKARDDAQAASRAKSAFLANTSHEIRTPLNGVLGLTRLALMPEVDDAQRTVYVKQILESAESLSAIITDILDLSKIEAGKLTLTTERFDLRALLDAVRRTYEPLAVSRQLRFELRVEPGTPGQVRGDRVRLRQILDNYLNNAFKFTAQGGITLEVRPREGERVRFTVSDTGPGIEAGDAERLFAPFTQVDESTTRRFGGTGLGLSICRELATLMQGAVGLDSTPGKGSRFWTEIPLATEHDTSQPAPRAPEPADDLADLRGARVLVVEDNEVNRIIAAKILSVHGVAVTEAVDGVDAVRAVDQAAREGKPFAAVLMDVHMPVMNGYEATRELRTRYDAAALPIIALTAAALASEREEAIACGMTGFLTKPFDPRLLTRQLAQAIGQPA